MRGDPRVAEAERRLKAAGLSDAWWSGLLERVEALPAVHRELTRETAPEAERRRTALAARMRELATAIEADPDARYYAPGGERARGMSIWVDGAGGPTLAEWLVAAADALELESARPLARRPTLKQFVIRGVAYWIDFYVRRALGLHDTVHRLYEQGEAASGYLPEVPRGDVVAIAQRLEIDGETVTAILARRLPSERPKRLETALLAGAVLDERITANDVTQAFRDFRRRYTKE